MIFLIIFLENETLVKLQSSVITPILIYYEKYLFSVSIFKLIKMVKERDPIMANRSTGIITRLKVSGAR